MNSRDGWRGAVLLDLDGTLVDTAPEIAEAANRMLAEFGLPPLQVLRIRRFIGRGVAHLIRQVLAASRLSGTVTEATAIARFDVQYARINGTSARVYSGVFAGLDALTAADWKLGCVTNKPQRFAEPLLTRTGLGKYFGTVVFGDSLSTMKPSAEPLLHACRALDADPAQSLMVGDSLHDAQAARAAGMPCYVVSYGYGGKRSIAALVRGQIVSNLEELPARLATQRRL